MRFILAAFLLALSPLSAATVYLRAGTPAGVQIVGCTNATPIVCTTAKAHGLANNDRVIVFGVAGNLAANSSEATPRYVQVVSSTQVALYSTAGTGSPVAGSGSYVSSIGLSWIGKATAFSTVDTHPRGFLDGANGSLTRALRCSVGGSCLTSIVVSSNTATATVPLSFVEGNFVRLAAGMKIGVWNSTTSALNATYTITATTDTTITFTTSGVANGTYNEAGLTLSRFAWTGNPFWDGLVTNTNAFSATYTWMADQFGDKAVQGALRYFIDRSFTKGRTLARNALLNPFDMAWGTTACDESVSYCNGRAPGVDYPRYSMAIYSFAFSLLEAAGDITGPEKALLIEQFFTDKTFQDQSCTVVPISSGPSVTCTSGTCTGTGFNSIPLNSTFFLNVDGYVHEESLGNNFVARMTARASDTSMTLVAASGTSPTYTGPTKYGRPWVSGDCGLLNLGNHHVGSPGTIPELHPPIGGQVVDGGASYWHNLYLTGIMANTQTAIPFLEDTAMARDLLSRISPATWDLQLAYAMQSWTGHTQAGATYHWYRSPWMMADIVWGLENSVTSHPSVRGTWFRNFLMTPVYAASDEPHVLGDGTERFLPFGEGSFAPNDAHVKTSAGIARFHPASDEARAFKDWILNRRGSGNLAMGWSSGQHLIYAFLGLDPNLPVLDNSTLPKQKVFNSSGYSTCSPLGMAYCNSDGVRYDFAVSRSGFGSANDTKVYMASMTNELDHQGLETTSYVIRKGDTPCLVGGDNTDCVASSTWPYRGSQARIGDTNLWILTGYPLGNPEGYQKATIDRSAMANDNYAYVLGNHAGLWRPVAAVTRAHRHWAHLKRSGKQELLVMYDDMAVTSPTKMRTYTGLAQNGESGEGVSSCPSGACSSNIDTDRQVLSTTTAGNAGLATKWLEPSGSSTVLKWNSTDPVWTSGPVKNDLVTACAGTSGTCASVSSYELITVHQIFGGAPSQISTTAHNPDANWTGFSSTDYTFMAARGGTLRTSMSAVTTSSTTDLFVVGLSPGTYDVSRNGIVVADNVTVSGSNNTLYAADIAAGAITVAQDGAPPDPIDIATSSLPDGTEDVSYSQSLSISGGTPAYACTVTVGALPAGLTLSSTGTISGTPTTAGSSSFTVSCTDSLEATPDTAALSITIGAASGGGGGSATGGVRGAARAVGGATIK